MQIQQDKTNVAINRVVRQLDKMLRVKKVAKKAQMAKMIKAMTVDSQILTRENHVHLKPESINRRPQLSKQEAKQSTLDKTPLPANLRKIMKVPPVVSKIHHRIWEPLLLSQATQTMMERPLEEKMPHNLRLDLASPAPAQPKASRRRQEERQPTKDELPSNLPQTPNSESIISLLFTISIN